MYPGIGVADMQINGKGITSHLNDKRITIILNNLCCLRNNKIDVDHVSNLLTLYLNFAHIKSFLTLTHLNFYKIFTGGFRRGRRGRSPP